jgi:hypothetical protein
MTRVRAALVCAAAAAVVAAPAAEAKTIKIGEFKLSDAQTEKLRASWVDQIYAKHSLGTWAPMRMELRNKDLKAMGLPSKRVLLKQRYRKPTIFRKGKAVRLGAKRSAAAEPGVASFAGTGFFGIRPGAFVLLMNGGSIGWCSLAHVYGSPGSYQISTAGHCGNNGDIATVVGVVGNNTPVLIDFGRFSSGTGDGGIGRDWALISIDSQWQSLVTPTMAFWGGPIGMYRATGEVVQADLSTGEISADPNPTLVQQVVHYGHGAGIGAGGTPRSGTALNWRSDYFTAFGAITPGDSGSGTNTLTGDAIGANRQAAGINTHIYVDGSLATGLGTFAGTRATLVGGSLANGQILPYPAPVPILP